MADVGRRTCGYNRDRIVKEAEWFDGLLGEFTIILDGLGCALIRREGQRFFSSLVNEPHQSQWAAIDGARSNSAVPYSGQYGAPSWALKLNGQDTARRPPLLGQRGS